VNIKKTKAYRTTYNEALYILTGTKPTEIKANLYRITKNRQNDQMDHEAEPKDWTQPADSELAIKTKERNPQFKYSQMEARTNTVLDREPIFTYGTN
jgi:hypothetical protein